MKKFLALSISISFLLANGYKIPEQSTNAIALSSANIANVNSADTAYYNPANMPFLKNKNYFEFLSTYIYLPKVKFDDKTNNKTYYSKEEQFLIPQFHFVSKDYNGYRFGLSFIEPAGLSKRWNDVIPQEQAKEFTLKTFELNPSIAKKITDNLSIAFGVRIVRSKGIAKALINNYYSYDMNGMSTDLGWNAAIAYHKNTNKFAITYRSKVHLTLRGYAKGYLTLPNGNIYPYNTAAKTSVPIPATLDIAYAKTLNNTTIEVVFERTYWSEYKELDFNFNDPIVESVFGKPHPKNWKDVNTYRIGITHKCTNKLTAMAGFTYDKTPVPDSTLDFALPDSDKYIYSGGLKYKINKNLTLNLSGLYAHQKSRDGRVYDLIAQQYTYGTFSKGGAYLLAIGLDYTY